MATFWGALLICMTFALSTSAGAGQVPEQAKEAADYALNIYNHNSKEEFLFKLLNYNYQTIQVIAGTEYVIEAELELTNCRKQEEPQHCPQNSARSNLMRKQCRFVVVVIRQNKGVLQSICKE
ncbi:cystatin-S-like [Engraulis encrasicolus]|uniref:cystatin-S-like n=1 Tax=Engraulis encrasicolus TaxID=184585 RepID=UPI002FD24DD4